MRPISKSFRIEENEDYGTFGVRPVGMPHADPLGGMAAAHDMLEHFPRDDGGIEDELQALGAAIYVRGIPGYFQQRGGNQDTAENIASDFPELYRHWRDEGFSLMPPGRTAALEEVSEGIVQRAVQKALALIHSEFVTYGEDSLADIQGFAGNSEYFVGWMRKGYRRAAKRYRDTQDWRVCTVFQEIERRVDELLEDGERFDGATLTVTADVQTERVTLSVSDGF